MRETGCFYKDWDERLVVNMASSESRLCGTEPAAPGPPSRGRVRRISCDAEGGLPIRQSPFIFAPSTQKTAKKTRSYSTEMNVRCFSSPDAAAENINLVYDDNSDSGSLYERRDLQIPLPLCSSSPLPPDLRCLVCRSDGLVHAVCRDLAQGAKPVLEAVGNYIGAEEGECPAFLSDRDRRWSLFLLIPLIALFVVLVLYWRQTRSNRASKDVGGELQVKAEPLKQGQVLDGVMTSPVDD